MKKIIAIVGQLLVVNFLLAQLTIPKVIVEKTQDITLELPDAANGKIKILNGQLNLGGYINDNYKNSTPSSYLSLDANGNVTKSDLSNVLAKGWLRLDGKTPLTVDDDVYTNGRVGIGTAIPNSVLEIRYDGATSLGNIGMLTITNKASSVDAYASIRLINDSDTQGVIWRNSSIQNYYAGANSLNFGFVEAFPISFVTHNKSRMVVAGNGNVGIGDLTPLSQLDFGRSLDANKGGFFVGMAKHPTNGNTIDRNDVISVWSDQESKYGLGIHGATLEIFSPTGHVDQNVSIGGRDETTGQYTDHLTVRGQSGNVGIGTTNPTAKLQVQGDLRLADYVGTNFENTNPTSFMTLDTMGNVTQYSFSAWEDMLAEIDSLKKELDRLDSLAEENSTLANEEVCITQNGNLMTVIQDIPTAGILDWEIFEDNGKKYALSASYNNNNSYNTISKLYAIGSNGHLSEIQSIPTFGAREWEAFEEGGKTYALVANHFNGSHNINSKLYYFNSQSEQLEAIQDIPTSGVIGWDVFKASGKTYALVANGYDGRSYNTNSKLYEFNALSEKFVAIQDIPTNGAYGWETYTIHDKVYALVVNTDNGSSRNINSKLYEFNATLKQFAVIQDIPTSGAYDWEVFEIDNKHYALVANHDNGSTRNINSKLYEINSLSGQLTVIQEIPTIGALDWEVLSIGDNYYALVANYHDNSSYNVNSKLYLIDSDTGQLAPIQDILTHGAFDTESFEIGDEQYVIVANSYSGSPRNFYSKLYSISENKKCLTTSSSLMERLLQWAVSQGFEID